MHSIMSSYNHAPYLPVWPLSNSIVLHSSWEQGTYNLPAPEHPGLPCNILPHTMTQESKASGRSDIPKDDIADLVKSDDRFLDQLEVMHYLNFSDY